MNEEHKKREEKRDEIRELSEDKLEKVSGGVGQETDDEPMGLCPTQASFEKWVE